MVKRNLETPPMDSVPIPPAWLTPKEAAEYTGLGVTTLYKSVLDQVTARKLGSRVLINRNSLDAFLTRLPQIGQAGRRGGQGRRPKKAA